MYARRPLEWANDDLSYVKRVIDFLFEEWEKIRDAFRLTLERPNLSIIATAALWEKLRIVSERGFRSDFSIKNRAAESKDAPSFGW